MEEQSNKTPPNLGMFLDPSGDFPKLYCNACVVGFTYSDMYIIGQINGKPNFIVNLSYTTAKSLNELLTGLIKNFEERAKVDIHTMDEIYTNLNNISESK